MNPHGKERQMKAALNEIDKDYAAGWEEVARNLQERGIYGGIAHTLSLRPGDIHVDLGSGVGWLLGALKQRFPESIMLGVESNVMLIAIAADTLIQVYDSIVIPHARARVELQPGKIRTVFDPPKEEYRERFLFAVPRVIGLIADDITDLSVLGSILKGRKVQSASLMFPGISNRILVQHGVYGEDDQKRAAKLLNDLSLQLRNRALQWMTDNVDAGGTCTLVDWFGTDAPDTEGQIAEFMNPYDRDLLKHWRYEYRTVLAEGASFGNSGFGFVDNETRSTHTGIVMLTRKKD